MMQMIVAPASMQHLWYMRGFLAMLGPVTYEMEDIVKATISFKISGRPYLATPGDGDSPAGYIIRANVDGPPKTDRSFEWYAEDPDPDAESYPAYWLKTTG